MILPNYTVHKSKRKSIRLVMRPNGTLAVYCPLNYTKKDIDATVKKYYLDLKEKHDARADVLFGDDGTLPYFGKRYPLIYNNNEKNFKFLGDAFSSPTDDKGMIREMYRKFLRQETRRYVTPTVAKVAKEFNFVYGSISIQSAYARFGSCNSKKKLNFSLTLAMFDPDFIYSVVCHELCHTVHLNHSTDFHRLVNSVCPQHDALHEKYSKEYGRLMRSLFFNPAS